MKVLLKTLLIALFSISSFPLFAQKSMTAGTTGGKQLFIDVHRLKPGQVKLEEVAQAHVKDLSVQGKYDAQFLKYWVDENKGLIFCLVSAPDSESLRKTHAEAHGLLPERIYPVTGGTGAALSSNKNLFLDIHYLGAGVSAANVAAAHQKDLAVQQKYGVNFTNYWFDEKDGVVMCLAETKDSSALIKTHSKAHGLLPDKVFKVRQGE